MNEIEDHPSIYIGQTANEHEYFLSQFNPFSDVTAVSRDDLLTRDDLVITIQWQDPTEMIPTQDIFLTLVGRSEWQGGAMILTQGDGILADVLDEEQTRRIWEHLVFEGEVVFQMIDSNDETFSVFSVDPVREEVVERQLELIGQPIDRTHALENLVT